MTALPPLDDEDTSHDSTGGAKGARQARVVSGAPPAPASSFLTFAVTHSIGVGQSAEVFFTPEDVRSGVPQKEMKEAVEAGRGSDDRWHVRKDGGRFWAGGMMTSLWNDDRKLRGFA